ncbi:YdeI/OmpD-associated family protein [uncultured Acetobacteroides sp.]|uniref:YdeI/OmpD-associated family protein n=1 Tax=uncultured Acetobacteroides sp. TaxID=1760811 RepID=UPI0029F56447|nr:YdeI/OmpD-associated family protein [uncultured Acetobacteroides sp.]
MKGQDSIKTLYVSNRAEWREWLEEHFEAEPEVWLVFPNKSTAKPCLLYNDAVEEALCFGWIDSTVKSLDSKHKIQWFLPRKNKNYYSQANKERLRWLLDRGLIHPKVKPDIEAAVREEFVFPRDIIGRLQQDSMVWDNYQRFSDPYKRIRIGYIEAARNRPDEFEKRLSNFIRKTRDGKLITGFGGIGKYY